MNSFKDLDITDPENEQLICSIHNKDVIKVCLQATCDQIKMCQQCLQQHNPSHNEITLYQLYKEVQQKVRNDQKVEINKEKFDIIFKNIGELRLQINLIFTQLEQDIKQYLNQKLNIDDIDQKYRQLQKINDNNYHQHIPILKLYYLNPNIFFDNQIQLSYLEDNLLSKLLQLNEELKQSVDKLKQDSECLFDIKTRKASEQKQEDQLQYIGQINGHDNVVRCVLKLYNNDIVTSSRDKTIKIWNQQFQCKQILKDHINWVQDLTLLPEKRFASCSDDKTIKIFSQYIEQWECINTLKGHESYVVRLVFNDQLQCLITCSTDGTLKLWNPQQKNCLNTLIGHENCVYTLSTLNNLVVSGDEGGQLIQWDLINLKIKNKQKGHSGCVNSILIRGQIISCGDDRKLNVWDNDLNLLFQIMMQRAELESLQYINDELIVGGDEQGYLQFINPIQGIILFEIPVHNDRIYKITYYDGLLCTASSDLSVKLYKF